MAANAKTFPAQTQQGSLFSIPFNDLNREHPDYLEQVPVWTKMDDLYLGSDQIKAKGEEYLPMLKSEESEAGKSKTGSSPAYARRLANAVFFNGIDRLAKYAIGHIYKDNPKYALDKMGQFAYIVQDCDLMGTELNTFLRSISTLSYILGHYFIMVDMPNMSGVDSRSAELNAAPRPFLVPVHPLEIINWSIKRSLDGTYQFDWLIQRYSISESDGPFDLHHECIYFKVWTKTDWKLYKVILPNEVDAASGSNIDTENLTAQLVNEGPNAIGLVPYIPVYSQFIRPMVSKPPLLESANLNIDHYRLVSQFIHGLTYHLNPILTLTGVSDDPMKTGATTGLSLPKGADAKYVETTGNGLKIAMETAEMVAREMWEAGLRTASNVGANTSAEARRLGQADFMALLLSIVNGHEGAYNMALKMCAAWVKAKLPDEHLIKLNRDFEITFLEANQAEFLLNARRSGEISKKLFLSELVRGEVVDKDLDIDAELTASAADLQKDLESLKQVENIKADAAAKAAPPAPPGNPAPKPSPPSASATVN